MQFTNQPSVDSLKSWIQDPYMGVFTNIASLRNTPIGLDFASKKPCKHQSYTSWAVSSLSYLYSFGEAADEEKKSRRRRWGNPSQPPAKKTDTKVTNPSYLLTLTPTEQEVKDMSKLTRIRIEKSELIFADHMIMPPKIMYRYAKLDLPKKLAVLLPNLMDTLRTQCGLSNSDIHALLFGSDHNTTYGVETLDVLKNDSRYPKLEKHTTTINEMLLLVQYIKTQAIHHNPENMNEIYTVTPTGASFQHSIIDPGKWKNARETWPSDKEFNQKYPSSHHASHNPAFRNLDPKPSKHHTTKDNGSSDANKNFEWSNTTKDIPIRVATVSSTPTKHPSDTAIPHSIMFNNLEQRLMDPTSAGTLGSITKDPNFRPTGPILALIKALQSNPSTLLDVAPQVRLLNFIQAVSVEGPWTDLTPYQFVRDWTTTDAQPYTTPRELTDLPDGKIVAMTLSTYLTFMSGYHQTLRGAQFALNNSGVDTEWTAIPVSSHIVKTTVIVPYIFAHLSSRYSWFNYYWQIIGRLQCPTDRTDAQGADVLYNVIPASQTVHIPAPISCILVLMDQPDVPNQAQLQIIGTDIPIYNGTGNLETVAIRPIWHAFVEDNSVNAVRHYSMLAYNELSTRNTVYGTSKMALSLASEFHTASKIGMYCHPEVQTRNRNPTPGQLDRTAAMAGAYTYWDNNVENSPAMILKPLASKSSFQSRGLDLETFYWNARASHQPNDIYPAGYNLTSFSPFHILPSGTFFINAAEEDDREEPHHPQRPHFPIYMREAAVNDIREFFNTYQIPTTNSFTRIAIHLGLIQTDPQSMKFYTAGSVNAWIHMLSVAQMSATSQFLSLNNMPMSTWSGYHVGSDPAFTDNLVDTLKVDISAGTIQHHRLFFDGMANGWATLDYKFPDEFYQMDTSLDPAFLSSSLTPSHLFFQWMMKTLAISPDSTPRLSSMWFTFMRQQEQALQFYPSESISRAVACCTIDAERYLPSLVKIADERTTYGPWLEQVSALSLRSSGAQIAYESAFLETYATTITPVDLAVPFVNDSKTYIINSTMEKSNSHLFDISTSQLQWPDPPTPPPTSSPQQNPSPSIDPETAILKKSVAELQATLAREKTERAAEQVDRDKSSFLAQEPKPTSPEPLPQA